MNRVIVAALLLWSLTAHAEQAPATIQRPRAATLALGCSGCHPDEERHASLAPVLAGMPRDRLIHAMEEFKSGRRISSIMNRVARGYQSADFAALADHFETAKKR